MIDGASDPKPLGNARKPKAIISAHSVPWTNCPVPNGAYAKAQKKPIPTMTALPWVWQINVSGASSRMLIDHGGSITIRNTNAPRARTPSSNPTMASTPGAYRQPAAGCVR